jgi:small-conductance mechanosensitive channel
MDTTFWQAHGDEISAAISLLVAIGIAIAVDRLIIGRGSLIAERVGTPEISREARTRLRVVRRLVFVIIIAIGVALALSQFTRIQKLATGVLASGAVLGLIAGFAAQQVLANMVAGVMLGITQPLRIGDQVELEQGIGRVRDITLTFTSIAFADGRMLIVPNETLMTTPLFNHSIDGTTELPARPPPQEHPPESGGSRAG